MLTRTGVYCTTSQVRPVHTANYQHKTKNKNKKKNVYHDGQTSTFHHHSQSLPPFTCKCFSEGSSPILPRNALISVISISPFMSTSNSANVFFILLCDQYISATHGTQFSNGVSQYGVKRVDMDGAHTRVQSSIVAVQPVRYGNTCSVVSSQRNERWASGPP